MLFTSLVLGAVALLSTAAAANPTAVVHTDVAKGSGHLPGHGQFVDEHPVHAISEKGELNATAPGAWSEYLGHNYTHAYHRETGKLQKRVTGGVYFCTDTNWRGKCFHSMVTTSPQGQCFRMKAENKDKVSSFGPDPSIRCLNFMVWSCYEGGNWRMMYYPGIGDLNTIGWNDQMRAFQCWW